MNHIRQAKESNQCGQACVAMLLGCDLAKALELVGHRGSTVTRELITVLRKGGLQVAGRLVAWREAQKLPTTAILKVKSPGRSGWHWALIHQGTVYDPDRDKLVALANVRWARRGRISSYLEVSGRARPTTKTRAGKGKS